MGGKNRERTALLVCEFYPTRGFKTRWKGDPNWFGDLAGVGRCANVFRL